MGKVADYVHVVDVCCTCLRQLSMNCLQSMLTGVQVEYSMCLQPCMQKLYMMQVLMWIIYQHMHMLSIRWCIICMQL